MVNLVGTSCFVHVPVKFFPIMSWCSASRFDKNLPESIATFISYSACYFIKSAIVSFQKKFCRLYWNLLGRGWDESDVFNTVNHGFSMIASGFMLKMSGM